MTLNNLAVLCKLQGANDEALSLYERAIQIFERGVEATHPNLATTLENYAALLRSLQHDAEAARLEIRAQSD